MVHWRTAESTEGREGCARYSTIVSVSWIGVTPSVFAAADPVHDPRPQDASKPAEDWSPPVPHAH
jgi:hypothetical protein